MDDRTDMLARRRELLDTSFDGWDTLVEELMRDNAALRSRVLQLEEGLARSTPPACAAGELQSRAEELEQARAALRGRCRQIATLERDYDECHRELERENSDLASLYVASSRLHGALEVDELVASIIEILLNFVGVRACALLVLDEHGRTAVAACQGVEPDEVPCYEIGEGVVGEALASGLTYEEGGCRRGSVALDRPAVCVPLRLGGCVVGAIVIWSFFEQKETLVEVDRELFRLLAAQAAPALHAAGQVAGTGALARRRLREILECRTTEMR